MGANNACNDGDDHNEGGKVWNQINPSLKITFIGVLGVAFVYLITKSIFIVSLTKFLAIPGIILVHSVPIIILAITVIFLIYHFFPILQYLKEVPKYLKKVLKYLMKKITQYSKIIFFGILVVITIFFYRSNLMINFLQRLQSEL